MAKVYTCRVMFAEVKKMEDPSKLDELIAKRLREAGAPDPLPPNSMMVSYRLNTADSMDFEFEVTCPDYPGENLRIPTRGEREDVSLSADGTRAVMPEPRSGTRH